MDQRPGVGVAVLINRAGAVLLMLRQGAHGAGSWAPPGGHVEFGESLEECAIRETLEETGLRVMGVRFRAITNDVFESYGRHYITIWMEATVAAGEPAMMAAEEMSDLRWFAWDALPQPLFLPFQHLLDGACYPAPDLLSSANRAA